MADNRAERPPDGAAETASPTGRSETQPDASPTAFLGQPPQTAIDWGLSVSEGDALDLFPSEHDIAGKPSAQTDGDPPSLEECPAGAGERPSSVARRVPLTEEAGLDDRGRPLRQANLMLKRLGEEMIGLNTELVSLGVLAQQLTSDYKEIHRIACEAQDHSVAGANTSDRLQQRRPSLAVQEDLGRQIDERFGGLNLLMHEVTVRTQMLQTQKDTIDCALREGGRVAEVVRSIEEQVAQLGAGEHFTAQKEALLRQVEQVALETTWHLEQKKQLRDEVGQQLARLSREAEALTASARGDTEGRIVEEQVLTTHVPLSASQAPFGAATMDVDRPQRTMLHTRLAAAIVGACVLVFLISFLVTGGRIKRARVGDGRLPTPNTGVELPSQQLNPVPHIDSPSAGSERAPVISATSGVRRDGIGIARSKPSAEREERGGPTTLPRRADAVIDPLPGSAPRENAVPDVSDSVTAPSDNLSGWWVFTNHVEQSSIHSFNDLTLGFRMQLVQTENRVRGHGVKWLENGRPLASRSRTPITVDGMIDGRRLSLTFTERGARRISRGSFEMQLAEDGSLYGRFSSDAARSSGRAQAVRTASQPQ
jgi:hypothetical protein